MRTLRTFVAIFVSLLGFAVVSAHAEERFEDVEKAYLKALYLKEKPILKEYLADLEKTRVEAETKGLNAVIKEIDRDIATLKARIKKQDKALKDLKDVAPLAVRTDRPDVALERLPTIDAPLAKAAMRGGVRYDPSKKALVGWTSRQAEVSMQVPTEKGVTYALELNYGTTEKGRLQITVGTEKFLPRLKDTGSVGKRVSVHVGEFTARGSTANISISVPMHHSKPFVQIHRLQLIPQPPSDRQ